MLSTHHNLTLGERRRSYPQETTQRPLCRKLYRAARSKGEKLIERDLDLTEIEPHAK
jgi:hypothetical protein